MKLGAYDYLLKPFDTEELKRITGRRLRGQPHDEGGRRPARRGHADRRRPPAAPCGSSATTARCRRSSSSSARWREQDVTVLVTGESGTGKELVARAIYHHSRRKDQPFMAVNCASIPDTLFESELFGYEQGRSPAPTAPTWASSSAATTARSSSTKSATCRVAHAGQGAPRAAGRRVRAARQHARPSRSTSACWRPRTRTSRQEVAAGRFREDLYYRLKIISVHLPPLRERLDDVPALVDYFVGRFVEEYDKPLRYVADQTIREAAIVSAGRATSASWKTVCAARC